LKAAKRLTVGKIIGNTPKRTLTEHWEIKQLEDGEKQYLERCKGCMLDQIGEPNACKRWNNRKDTQISLSRFIKKREEFMLELSQEMIENIENRLDTTMSTYESSVKEVICEDLDVELIKKQQISQELKEELIEKNQKIKLRDDKETLTFYTDGSL